MLFLKPPFQMIEGVAVFADHADPLQFYFMPAAPHLPTESNRPKIQLIRFRGQAGNGGFLTFEVNLALPSGIEETIKDELVSTLRLRSRPRLFPVPMEGGSVSLVMLGLAFDAEGQPILGDDQRPRFVVRKAPTAHPALYGDNQAIFSVELDRDGAELVEESLRQSDFMPIGVVYSLDFLALRPAFTVKVSADWNRVQTQLSKSFKVDILFSSTEIDKVVDKLIEDQVVNIEVDSFLPEGEDAGSWVGRRDQAVEEFKDMVLQNFFKPSLDPVKPEPPDGWDKAGDFVEKLSLLGATGGMAAAGKFSYVEKDYTRIDQKRIDLRMNERVTVKKSIYPQAMLKNLARMPVDAQGHVDLSGFLLDVTLDDDWFALRKLKAHSLVDYDNDRVESVTITASYDGRPQTIRLTKDQAEGEREWNSILRDNAMVRPVEFEYSVAFRGVDTADRPGIIASPRRITIGDEFDVSPRGEGLYFIDDIQMGASTIPWERYPQIAVELRYRDPMNRLRLDDTFILTKDKPEATWKRFRLNAALSEYDYRITYMAANNRDVLVDWNSTDQERLIVRDPQPLRRVLQVAPAVDWRLVSMLFVELRYVDDANHVDEQQTLSFLDTAQDRGPKTFSISLVDGTQRLVSYAPTFILKDNRTIVVPPSMTVGSIIVLRTDMAGHRVVTVRPPEVSFAARGIVRIEAALAYADPENGLAFEDKLTFSSQRDSGAFEFDYVSSFHSSYSCNATLILENGLAVEHDMGHLDGDKVILPSM